MRRVKTFGRILIQFGINPRKFVSVFRVFHFLKDVIIYRRKNGVIDRWFPILDDYSESAGSTKGHYFHQDLLVASFVFNENPVRHIDVGSRIDGFVAHVASFRKIEIIDVRDLPSTGHKNISFIKGDLVDNIGVWRNSTDSLSCLHVLEHIGLGRYGDRIDPQGHYVALNNLFEMLKPDGILYLGVPIASKSLTYFNAHRVFSPKDIISMLPPKYDIEIVRFDYIDDDGNIIFDCNVDDIPEGLCYGCGIFSFRKGGFNSEMQHQLG